MAKDPTQGPVSTYDAEGNPTQTNVEETPIEEEVEEVTVDESTVEEEVEETASEEEEELSDEGDGESEAADDENAPIEEADYSELEGPAEPDENEDAEEDTADEEDSFEAHEHEVDAPLTYADAEKRLKETPYAMLREMVIADGLKPERSGAKLIVQLLNHWFSEPPSLAGSDEPQMSARIRRIKEASSQ
jgi:hypothetical protein